MTEHERTEYPYLIYIQFEESRKAYSFGSFVKADTGDQVVVETVRGQEIGTVCMPAMPFDSRKAKDDCKPVLRIATPEDLARREENRIRAKDAMAVCTQCIRRLGLDMHLISSEYTLDCAKIIFTYVSDERVDFRQLLKDLAHQLHCRIELRQVGPRNKAKMVGGIGSCGMECCCSRFMSEFDTVSINMAKNQLLALNISKLSGQCGKLKCCLRFENDLYTRMRRNLPRINSQLVFEGTRYRLSSMNLLQQQAKLENREEVKFVDFDTLWPDR
ncbi:regulatory iron-sulfur-containing complex subunit RicT, partial [Faecalibaculum rodentium]